MHAVRRYDLWTWHAQKWQPAPREPLMAEDRALPVIDTTRAHPARIYDSWLGGKDNFAADREAAALALEAYPALADAVRSNRAFLGRVVRFLSGEGIRQFLDIGTGLPAADNTHEVAQREVPESRIVYVDNDPIVLRHAQALLTSTPDGACDYIQADLRDPETIVAEAARTLDFDRPVALLLLAVLQFALDEDDPYGLVATLMAALPSGSYLVISHPTDDFNPNRGESMRVYNERSADQAVVRDRAETARFFDGLDLLDPGVVPVAGWRPDSDATAARPSSMWCGVARKP
jgi:O-methyltransferase involved in polyketide biosynthesis